jgi:anti-sigma factor RsiW
VTCRELNDFLADWTADALPADTRAAFERHLAGCEDCRVYLRSYEETIRLGREAFAQPDGALPDDVPEALVQAVLAARRGR